jgi:hypothetical protein
MKGDITVYNVSKQAIGLSARPPGSDFFRSEQQIWIGPRKTVTLPKSHVNIDQITNLCAKGMLKVMSDTSIE